MPKTRNYFVHRRPGNLLPKCRWILPKSRSRDRACKGPTSLNLVEVSWPFCKIRSLAHTAWRALWWVSTKEFTGLPLPQTCCILASMVALHLLFLCQEAHSSVVLECKRTFFRHGGRIWIWSMEIAAEEMGKQVSQTSTSSKEVSACGERLIRGLVIRKTFSVRTSFEPGRERIDYN